MFNGDRVKSVRMQDYYNTQAFSDILYHSAAYMFYVVIQYTCVLHLSISYASVPGKRQSGQEARPPNAGPCFEPDSNHCEAAE